MPLDVDAILAGYKDACSPTLNTNQIAEMLGSTAEVVRSKVKRGEIPAYRWGKNLRFFRDEVLDWPRAQQVGPRNAADEPGAPD